MVNVWIDELTHCLKDNDTGELIDTEVVRSQVTHRLDP